MTQHLAPEGTPPSSPAGDPPSLSVLPNPDYRSLPQYRKAWRKVDEQTRIQALASFMKPFHACYRRHLSSPRLDYDVRIHEGDGILRRLQEDGCSLSRIEAGRKATLTGLTAPLAQAVHAHLDAQPRPRFSDQQLLLDRVEHAEIFDAVEETLSAEHIFAAGAAYVGAPIRLKTLAIQVNTQRATAFTYPVLDEEGIPEPKTRYFHIDSALWPPLKVLIYLNRVTLDEGPFRYVVGSHRLATEFELMVRKTNDKAKIYDELFLSLPAPFRMYTDFGDDMDPNGEAAAELLRNERAYGDGESDLILFDFNGVHRGGFVRQGHRYMLQCGFDGLE